MRGPAILLLLAATPAVACPWHGSGGHSPWGIGRYAMSILPFEEPANMPPAPPPPSRAEAVAALRQQLLATTPALKVQPEASSANSAR